MGDPVKAGEIVPAMEGFVPAHERRLALLTIGEDRRVLRADFLEAGDAVPPELAGAIPQASTLEMAAEMATLPDNLFALAPDAQGECLMFRRYDMTHGAA